MSEEPVHSPFTIPIFRAVWIASVCSNFGGLIQAVGASWMITQLGGSPQQVALVQASVSLPIMLLSLWAGAMADNLDRRKIMLLAQSFMLVVSLGLAICTYAGLMSPWFLLCLTFLIGCGTAINSPAWQASIGDMVPRPVLPGAIAMNSMGFNIARSVGPALGGAIVAFGGALLAFAINATSYLGLINVLARWKPVRAEHRLPRERLAVAMVAGVRYAAMSPSLLRVMARASLFGIAASSIPALLPLVARDLIGGGPLTYGLLLGSFGFGAVIGAALSGRLRRKWSTEIIVVIATLSIAAGEFVAGSVHLLVPVQAGLLLAGAGWLLALSSFNSSMQLNSPRWVVARSISLYQMSAFGAMAGGSWLFGHISETHGAALALQAAAAVQLAGLIVGRLFPMPGMATANLDPRARWIEPDLQVPIEARSGPIVITIEHRIARMDIPRFLAAMEIRRRMRIRDGARGWTLLRDLEDPELWVERYRVPTWLDYIRHHERRTKADAENSRTLMALRLGGGEPVVHRMIERRTGLGSLLRGADPHELPEPMTDPTRSN
ncbi:MAG TPA: MFS transporter [Sphingobium sp.]|nr:MFS transporter [Sphingobium sp.]